MSESAKWRFGVVANITESHTGEDGQVYYGTKEFTGGTKVYLDGKNWDPEEEYISVIGRNRFGRMSIATVHVEHLEHVRAQRIYKPKVLDILSYEEALDGWFWWGRTAADRKETLTFVEEWERKFGQK